MESLLPTLLLPELSWADKVAYLAWRLHSDEGITQMPLRHTFEPGRYIREIEIPAHCVFIGKVHRAGHLMVLVKGELVLITKQGSVSHRAPSMVQSWPGYQTVLYTLCPVVGQTVHENPDDSQNISQLEARIFEPVGPILARGEQVARGLQIWLG